MQLNEILKREITCNMKKFLSVTTGASNFLPLFNILNYTLQKYEYKNLHTNY